MSGVTYAKYTWSAKGVQKDGHDMFPFDIAKDLNRKSYLEAKLKVADKVVDAAEIVIRVQKDPDFCVALPMWLEDLKEALKEYKEGGEEVT